ncbi:hypothetical protein L7F22_024701 [Adiantum nelumboides]|nr:hypothetical protein [Adiantum nelumboides]
MRLDYRLPSDYKSEQELPLGQQAKKVIVFEKIKVNSSILLADSVFCKLGFLQTVKSLVLDLKLFRFLVSLSRDSNSDLVSICNWSEKLVRDSSSSSIQQFWFCLRISGILVLFCICHWFRFRICNCSLNSDADSQSQIQVLFYNWFTVLFSRSGSGSKISESGLISVTGLNLVWFQHKHIESASIYTSTYYPSTLGSGPLAGTQGSATQDPHIAASDSSSDFDVMEGYPMQQHLESSSQDLHALGQQLGVSMFSRLKETLSRATRSKHATNEINEGGGEVDSPFTSQIDPILSESVHVSTPATTPIGHSKLTPSKTLLPNDKSLAEVQEVECYTLAAREKEIKSLCKAEQRRATLAKDLMTLANPLQSPELTTLKSQPIESHIASGSKDTPNAAILNGVFLNENWEYNLQTEKLTDLYTSYTYHVDWLDVIQATSNSTSVDEQQRMICDVIHNIVQMERQNLGINMPSMGPMRFLDTTKAKQPTISQMETPSVSPMDPSYIVSPGVSMQSERTHGSFSFPNLMQPSLEDLPTSTMNMTGGAPSTSLASTTPLHTSVAPMPIPSNTPKDIELIVDAYIKGKRVSNVYVDRGAQMCVITERTMHRLGLGITEPPNCHVKLANNSQVKCLGIIKDVHITILDVSAKVDFYVMPSKGESYPFILGKPWLMEVNADQKWGSGKLVLQKGKRIVYDMKLGKQSNICFETSTDEESSDESSHGDEESSMEVMGLVFHQPQAKESSTSKEVEVVVQEELILEERLRKMLAKDLTKEEEEDYINTLKRYPHLFITHYSMIKGVNGIQHHIDLKPDANSVAQKLRRLGVVQ